MRTAPLLVLLLLLGCNDKPQSDLPTTRMQIGSETFTLEIAATPLARETGLMRRDSMPEAHGMIFIFPTEEQRSFWMMNTRIPLDILFVDAAGKVDAIGQMEPYSGRAGSKGPVKYAIELNKGMVERVGLKEGDLLEFPEDVRTMDVPR